MFHELSFDNNKLTIDVVIPSDQSKKKRYEI